MRGSGLSRYNVLMHLFQLLTTLTVICNTGTRNYIVNNVCHTAVYNVYDETFETENYLDIILNKNTNLPCHDTDSLSSPILETERGCHQTVPRDQRLCKFCNLRQVETVYHFLFAFFIIR